MVYETHRDMMRAMRATSHKIGIFNCWYENWSCRNCRIGKITLKAKT